MRRKPSNACTLSTSPPPPEGTGRGKILGEERILDHWEKDILRAARRFGYGTKLSTVDDLAQEARIRVLGAVRTRKSRQESYLRRTIANALRSTLRREPRYQTVPYEDLDDASRTVAPSHTDIMAISQVAGWIINLPARLAMIYEQIYVKEASQREAAAVLGVSQPRVAQLHRQLLELGKAELAHLGS